MKSALLLLLFAFTTVNIPTGARARAWVRVPNRVRTIDLESGVHFYAYTNRSNVAQRTELRPWDTDSLRDSGLVPGQVVKIYVHGLLSTTSLVGGAQGIKNAYLRARAGVRNVILVNWHPNMTSANQGNGIWFDSLDVISRAIPEACDALTEFVSFLSQHGFNMETLHLIGQGAGANVAGCAGKRVGQVGVPLGRVTGLDPSVVPFFTGLPARDIPSAILLSVSSARFVDVLHTDVDGFGLAETLGHLDLYSNGGRGSQQQGCMLLGAAAAGAVTGIGGVAGAIGGSTFTSMIVTHLCAHWRSVEIWQYLAASGSSLDAYRCGNLTGNGPDNVTATVTTLASLLLVAAREPCPPPAPWTVGLSKRVQYREDFGSDSSGNYYLHIGTPTFTKILATEATIKVESFMSLRGYRRH